MTLIAEAYLELLALWLPRLYKSLLNKQISKQKTRILGEKKKKDLFLLFDLRSSYVTQAN